MVAATAEVGMTPVDIINSDRMEGPGAKTLALAVPSQTIIGTAIHAPRLISIFRDKEAGSLPNQALLVLAGAFHRRHLQHTNEAGVHKASTVVVKTTALVTATRRKAASITVVGGTVTGNSTWNMVVYLIMERQQCTIRLFVLSAYFLLVYSFSSNTNIGSQSIHSIFKKSLFGGSVSAA